MRNRFVVVMVMLLGTTPAAFAQNVPEPEWGSCTRSTDTSPDTRIKGCEDFFRRHFTCGAGTCRETVDSSTSAELSLRIGLANLDKGAYDLAILDYGRAMVKGSTEGYLGGGVAYALSGDLHEAKQHIEEAERLSHAPGTPEVLVYRIRIIGSHLILVENKVEPPSVLRELLETKIHVTHER